MAGVMYDCNNNKHSKYYRKMAKTTKAIHFINLYSTTTLAGILLDKYSFVQKKKTIICTNK